MWQPISKKLIRTVYALIVALARDCKHSLFCVVMGLTPVLLAWVSKANNPSSSIFFPDEQLIGYKFKTIREPTDQLLTSLSQDDLRWPNT